MLVITVSFFIAASIIMESVGVWARVIGAANQQPTTGYSTHVRIATLGRFFILLSAPTIGFLVDKGASAGMVSSIGAIAFAIVSMSISVFYFYGLRYMNAIYCFLNKGISVVEITEFKGRLGKVDKKFAFYVVCAFIFTTTGLIVVNILATLLPQYRASIVQMSALITAFGTLVHIFFVDPKLSSLADSNIEQLKKYTRFFLLSRAVSSIFLSILFLLVHSFFQ